MRNFIISFVATLLLVGCEAMPTRDGPLFVKYKYVVISIPEELLEIPPPVYKIDPNTTTDRETGVWMIDSERRAIELEKRLKRIKEYQKKQQEEVAKLPAPDVIKR